MGNKIHMKKHSLLQNDRFQEFSPDIIRSLIHFQLLILWAFAVSFPKGGNTFLVKSKELVAQQVRLAFG